MTKRISAARLKVRFFETFARVCRGETFSITEKRKVIARIAPLRDFTCDAGLVEALDELAALESQGASVEQMRASAELHGL